MGHDSTSFLVQPVDENFVCGICHDVLCRPTTACSDGHTFCAACLDAVTQKPFRCPVCRAAPLAAFALNRPLQNMIGELEVHCPHHDAAGDDVPKSKRAKTASSSSSSSSCRAPKGCPWHGKLKDLEAHLRSCRFEAVDCPLGCGVRATKNELEAHQLECPRRMVTCDQGCGKEVRADLLSEHKERECGNTLVKCNFCNEEMTRSQLGTSSRNINGYIIEARDKLTGHYKECPKAMVTCPHYGCYAAFKREDAPAHHTTYAHKHARLAHKAINDLEQAFDWERMEVTFKIPAQKLAGDRNITLKSGCCPAAGKEIYIKLKATAQNSAVKVFLCAEAPEWTPVRVKSLSITAPLVGWPMFDDEVGRLELAFNEDGCGGKPTNLEGSPDPSLGGELKCRRRGARIEYSDRDSDQESEYEYDEDTVTRKDLVDAAEQDVGDERNVNIEAVFWAQKLKQCTLECR